MMQLIAGGLIGLALGAGVRLSGLCRRETLCAALALHAKGHVRWYLWALGECLLLSASLMWLAVIDVDMLHVLPLHAGVLAGGMLYGAVAGLVGVTPLTALAGFGGGRMLESLCTIAGCLAGGLLLDVLQPLLDRMGSLLSLGAKTLFRTTLDEPYLFSGGFLALGCLGALLLAAGLCFRPAPPPEPSKQADDAPVPPPPQEDAVVAVLPGEEPLVVDAAESSAEEEGAEPPDDPQPEETSDAPQE